MADNVVANAGAGGATFATDLHVAETAHWPITKVAWGTRDTAYNIVDAANGLPVQPGTSTTWAVTQSGTWNVTNITGTISLPTGAATAAKQPALGTAGAASADVITVQGIASMVALKVDGSGFTQPVSGTFWQATQPISAASLPLPTGAATAAKQPALGTAGTASADVITVQGIASMTALKVDGSGFTQPVSGTVTVQQTTASNLKVDLSGTAANATAIKVDGSAVTQPTNPRPAASGGLSFVKVLSAASTNKNPVKASAGQIYAIYLSNTNASARYLHLYNVASASVTVGTTVPDLTLTIPGNASGAGFVLNTGGLGIAFGTAITYALTTGAADNDSGAVAANEIVGAIFYA